MLRLWPPWDTRVSTGETVGVLESVVSRWGCRCPTEGGPARPPAGTRNAVLNTEARTIDADVLSRRCVLMRLLDFSYEQYQKALRQSAGAVVIILPRAMAAVPQDVIRVSAPPRLPHGLGSRNFRRKKTTGFGVSCVTSGRVPAPAVPSALQRVGCRLFASSSWPLSPQGDPVLKGTHL